MGSKSSQWRLQGGVLIISHNKEFCDNVATEKWIMQGGRLRIEGESIDTSKELKGSERVKIWETSLKLVGKPCQFRIYALEMGKFSNCFVG